jgi:hypothetical protein
MNLRLVSEKRMPEADRQSIVAEEQRALALNGLEKVK